MSGSGCKRIKEKIQKNVRSKRRRSRNPSEEKQEKVEELEKALMASGKQIQEMNEEIVDLDDEVNSAYLCRSRMVDHLVSSFDVLRKISKTCEVPGPGGRLVLDLEGVAPPEVVQAVRSFLEKQDPSLPPTFEDVKGVVKDSCRCIKPSVSKDDVNNLASTVYSKVLEGFIRMRKEDAEASAMSIEVISDPAEHDEELERKLKKNKLLRRTEEVVEKFVTNYKPAEDEDQSDDDSDEEYSS
jgi:hypothetical protein